MGLTRNWDGVPTKVNVVMFQDVTIVAPMFREGLNPRLINAW
jgi:hypothetical protein